MTYSPLIVEVKGNALDDGPGIRSVVFFKGCPLSCVWCHNPESQSVANELSFDKAVCGEIGDCFSACPESALSLTNPHFVDREKCTLCFKCTEACPSGSLRPAAGYKSVEEVVDLVLKDRAFYQASGGGVTLSGGEPTLFLEYISALLKRLKKDRCCLTH